MAAPATARGLSPADQKQIRESLAGGRRPKVVFTDAAGQIAGQTGQVVALADPADSDEWITVRFGKDELPFSPSDLSMPGRAKAARPVSKSRRPAAEPMPRSGKLVDPEFVLDRPPEPVTRQAGRKRPEPTAPSAPEPTAPSAPEPKVRAEPKRATKSKTPASLAVTLSYADREWTLAATQGAKALAKPYVISPADALRVVALVDVPAVQEAVEAIIAAERAQAQERAMRLRAELAEIEARLAELGP